MRLRHSGGMDLTAWLRARGGIAHRNDILEAGFSVAALRARMRAEDTTVLRRAWVVLEDVDPDLRAAAAAGGRVACVSLARRRGWWMPPGVDEKLHLRLSPGAGSRRGAVDPASRLHWTAALAPVDARALEESTEDALAHIAGCVPRDQAIVLWESAARVERLTAEALRAIPWPTRAAAECAAEVQGLADSGLETVFVRPLRRWGLTVRQQIVLVGRPVDALIGERLVVQIDGFAHHSSAAQRAKDIAHDAELRLRGYTVLRFAYAQVLHDWPLVERTIRRAVAARLHIAA